MRSSLRNINEIGLFDELSPTFSGGARLSANKLCAYNLSNVVQAREPHILAFSSRQPLRATAVNNRASFDFYEGSAEGTALGAI